MTSRNQNERSVLRAAALLEVGCDATLRVNAPRERAQNFDVQRVQMVARHGRYVIFQMAEIAVPRKLFQDILRLIAELRAPPAATPACGD